MAFISVNFFEVRIGCGLEPVEHGIDDTILHLDAELAYKASVVARLTQEGWIASVHECGGKRRFGKGITVCALIKAGEDRRTAGGTDGRGGKGIFEPNAAGCKIVHDWGMNDRIARAPKGIVALIISHDEDNIRRRGVG